MLHQFKAMASSCRVLIDGMDHDNPRATSIVECAMNEVRRIEAKYSRYRADSVLSRINAGAGLGISTPIDQETAHLLRFAGQLYCESGGLFDITSGVLRKAWDFRNAQPPDALAIDAVLPLVGWDKVALDDEFVELPMPGMELDLGGIGKEYAADRVATILRGAGYSNGYVNLGGDIRLLGPKCDGTAWLLGIAHPRVFGELAAEVLLADGAIATSGDYERYIECSGQRYCHVLNPRTGWPSHDWQSVSVVAPACLAAGALSTVAMLKGSHAPKFLREQGVAHVLVDAAGKVARWRPQDYGSDIGLELHPYS